MKEFKAEKPILVIGGKAGNFLGEYMAGGILIILGLQLADEAEPITGDYFGTGMHGGVIYTRKPAELNSLGKEVKQFPVDANDIRILEKYIKEFSEVFGRPDALNLNIQNFSKYIPISKRPYGRLYVNA